MERLTESGRHVHKYDFGSIEVILYICGCQVVNLYDLKEKLLKESKFNCNLHQGEYNPNKRGEAGSQLTLDHLLRTQ